MPAPIQIKRRLNRMIELFPGGNPNIPSQLYAIKAQAPDLANFPLPLPSKKSDYTCFAESRGGVMWYGAKTGLTRWDPNAPRKEDRVQYFSATRHLPDNEVKAISIDNAQCTMHNDYEVLWVLTATGAAKITMRWLTGEEKADILLEESLRVVDRRGMMTQRHLSVPGRPETAVPYNESDNDGCFGCGYAMGELLHYAVLRRELGADHPKAIAAKAVATRASEAMLLLLFMPCRGDGFTARTYMTPHEPVPGGGGLYFKKLGDGTARLCTTERTLRDGTAGTIIPCPDKVPPRLAKLYEDEGFTDKGLVYKADTSSDELTLHFAHLYYLHLVLGDEDPELTRLAIEGGSALLGHILDHGNELIDAFGEPTTWAKYSERYFQFGSLGWVDACLNSTELLMYLRVMMQINPENARWQAAYDTLLARGYQFLGQKHAERLDQMCAFLHNDPAEEIMYGDHMLATAAFWPLILLEPDESLKALYRAGFVSWRGSIGREFNPGYDLPFALTCPDEYVDWARLEQWFHRNPASRLASCVNVAARHDMPARARLAGDKETGFLLPPDEYPVSKYDRNPNAYRDEESGGARTVESCYVYTFAYWFGRWYGLVDDHPNESADSPGTPDDHPNESADSPGTPDDHPNESADSPGT
ncbi:MAG: hypothetical protein FWE98_07745, partial [Oscillospiraceae bacterium]|nr:hypothetical protein [Oscillospiraceae bacterium]